MLGHSMNGKRMNEETKASMQNGVITGSGLWDIAQC